MASAKFFSTFDLQPIPAIDAVRDAHTHLQVALAPYAMRVGEKVDALDYEHIQKAFAILSLLLMTQDRGGGR